MAKTFVKMVYFALFTLAYFTAEISGDERPAPEGISSMKYYDSNFYASVTGSGCSYWAMSNGGTDDCIQIRKFKISHLSDRYRKNRNYGGIIVYDWGRYPGIPGGTAGSPGHVMLADTSDMRDYDRWIRRNNRRHEGQVHGYTVWRLFHENPSVLSSQWGMKFAGFAVKNGVTKFNSGALNTASYWELQQREMVAEEQDMVDALVHAWKTYGPGQSYNSSQRKRNPITRILCQLDKAWRFDFTCGRM